MEQTIYTDLGEKYVTLTYHEERRVVNMRLHRYDPQNISVSIDCKAIPQLVNFLELARSK
jgi:hypothetical protein